MDTNSDIGIAREHIAHLLSDGFWKVPRYQRGYKWEEEQVQELLRDVKNAQMESKNEYFLGSIVSAKSDAGIPEIVDGQQRMATVSILIAAIRDCFYSELKDPETAELIQGKYLLEKVIKTKEPKAKLKLSDIDHDFFLHKVLLPPSKERKSYPASKTSHKKIEAAQKLCRTYVQTLIQQATSPEDVLHDLIEYLSTKTMVILVRVSSQQNAFIIFETLNDRGLDLAITDLLKNFLFHRSAERIDEVQQRWTEMLVTIEGALPEEAVKDFLRHQWSSVYGLTRERELFQKVKDTVLSKQAAFDYAEALRSESILFAALNNPSHEYWKGYPSTTRDDLGVIRNVLQLEKRITPLLLAVLVKFTKAELIASLRMAVGWGVRISVGYSVAGQLERMYSEAAKGIRAGTIKSAQDIYNYMKQEIPSDTAFENAFQVITVPKASIARYLLRKLEEHLMNEKQHELVPSTNEQELTLEHILPENRSSNTWAAFSDETHDAYKYRLGNMTLLKGSPNSTSGNAEWKDKKSEFAKSKLLLNGGLGKYANWTAQEIEERQTAFAKDAVKIWPAKPK